MVVMTREPVDSGSLLRCYDLIPIDVGHASFRPVTLFLVPRPSLLVINGQFLERQVLLVRLFISLHCLKPIQLPGADEMMNSHAVQKPQIITSTSDRLPNMARPPVISLQTDPMCLWCNI